MKTPLGTQVRTNEVCPESGAYKVRSAPSTMATMTYFVKGDRMPPYNGVAVAWQLRSYA